MTKRLRPVYEPPRGMDEPRWVTVYHYHQTDRRVQWSWTVAAPNQSLLKIVEQTASIDSDMNADWSTCVPMVNGKKPDDWPNFVPLAGDMVEIVTGGRRVETQERREAPHQAAGQRL